MFIVLGSCKHYGTALKFSGSRRELELKNTAHPPAPHHLMTHMLGTNSTVMNEPLTYGLIHADVTGTTRHHWCLTPLLFVVLRVRANMLI